MQDYLSTTSRLVAILIAILFVAAVSAALLAVNLERQLSNPETYKQALVEQDLYARLPAILAEQVSANGQANPAGLPVILQSLTQADWETIFARLTTPEGRQVEIESVVDRFFAYLNTSEPQLNARISLSELKTRLASEEGLAAFIEILQRQPACTDEQMLQIATTVLTGGDLNAIPVCNPPPELLTQVTPLIQAQLVNVAANVIPGEIDLAQAIQGRQSSPAEDPAANFRLSYQRARLYAGLTLLAPIFLILLVTVFAVRSFKGLLLWWGIPILAAGLAGILLALSVVPLLSWIDAHYLAALRPADLSPAWTPVISDFLVFLSRRLAVSITLQAGVLFLIGILIALVGFLVPRR
ncbi:MAG: hypothetical protein EHM70_05315 [Chloroflexota bacterium]|nr:MAG: hypothetical protein EHM70_05315 [Chloroflexota bacterium]